MQSMFRFVPMEWAHYQFPEPVIRCEADTKPVERCQKAVLHQVPLFSLCNADHEDIGVKKITDDERDYTNV